MLSLRPRTPTSFEALCDISDVASYLRDQGYSDQPIRNPPTEYARLQKQRTLIVLYKSGTVLVQGAAPQIGVDLLNQFTAQSALF